MTATTPRSSTGTAAPGWYTAADGDLDAARETNQRVVDTLPALLGETHPAVLCARANQASDALLASQVGVAAEISGPVFEAMRRLLGRHHPQTLVAAVNFAHAQWVGGRIKEATALRVPTAERLTHALGAAHPLARAAHAGERIDLDHEPPPGR